jgi:hypothetical protein
MYFDDWNPDCERAGKITCSIFKKSLAREGLFMRETKLGRVSTIKPFSIVIWSISYVFHPSYLFLEINLYPLLLLSRKEFIQSIFLPSSTLVQSSDSWFLDHTLLNSSISYISDRNEFQHWCTELSYHLYRSTLFSKHAFLSKRRSVRSLWLIWAICRQIWIFLDVWIRKKQAFKSTLKKSHIIFSISQKANGTETSSLPHILG